MALTTYAGLKASVADWLNRTDLTNQIPDFIALAEDDFNANLRLRWMQTRKTFVVASEYVALSPEYAGIATIRVRPSSQPTGRFIPLDPTSWDEIDAYPGNRKGRPCEYCVVGSQLRVYPAPDQQYDAEALIYQRITPLSDANQSNTLLQRFPSIYLFGALTQASIFLDHDERVQMFASRYQGAIESASRRDDLERGASRNQASG